MAGAVLDAQAPQRIALADGQPLGPLATVQRDVWLAVIVDVAIDDGVPLGQMQRRQAGIQRDGASGQAGRKVDQRGDGVGVGLADRPAQGAGGSGIVEAGNLDRVEGCVRLGAGA